MCEAGVAAADSTPGHLAWFFFPVPGKWFCDGRRYYQGRKGEKNMKKGMF